MQLTAIDDAAWASAWRARQVGEKVALSACLVVTALVGPAWPAAPLVALVSIVALLGPATVRPGVLLAVMTVPLAFVGMGALSIACAVGGVAGQQEWWRWGPFSLGRASLLRAVAATAHALAGSLAVMVLALTTPVVDLVTWGRRWRIPDPLLEVASLTYRMVFVLLATTVAVRDAQRARLGDARRGPGGLHARLAAVGDLTGSVLVRSWDRARRLEQGLAGRGYESALTTLPVHRAPSARFRWGAAAGLGLVWLVCLWSRRGGWGWPA